MDEIHDWDILKEILHKKERLINSQKETIALLETQLFNERLKNDNLDSLVKASDRNLTNPTED
jgi:hypothetical protein